MKLLLKVLATKSSLSTQETCDVFNKLLTDTSVTDAQIGAYLCATALRLPEVDELVGGATSLRSHMLRVNLPDNCHPMLDTCGTGGSGLDTFTTSTTSAFVVAASGLCVAKHGNRAATSKCGSADVLNALGINITPPISIIQKCAQEAKFCFMFAPNHHGATKRVALIRKEVGFRTIFNFLGPLCNPAGAEYQMLGVSNLLMVDRMAEALCRLGTKRCLVVCGEDGLDEITLAANTKYAEVNNNKISYGILSPEMFGFNRVSHEEICGADPVNAAIHVRSILAGEQSAYRNLVLMNAGAALYVGGKADSIKDGIEQAKTLIDNGSATKVLEKAIAITSVQNDK